MTSDDVCMYNEKGRQCSRRLGTRVLLLPVCVEDSLQYKSLVSHTRTHTYTHNNNTQRTPQIPHTTNNTLTGLNHTPLPQTMLRLLLDTDVMTKYGSRMLPKIKIITNKKEKLTKNHTNIKYTVCIYNIPSIKQDIFV